VGESLDFSFIVSPFRGMVLVGVVIVIAIVIIVPFTMSFAIIVVSFLAPIFDPVTCISIVYNIMQVPIVLISFSAVLFRGVMLLAESLCGL
jgi:hypothetical protein